MTRTLLLLAIGLLAAAGAAAGQALRVEVRMNGEALDMAYVLVNGRQAALTDSLGEAVLDVRTLREGDRIGAAYVGAATAEVAFDRQMAQSGVCRIEMTPDFVLDPLVVRAELTGRDLFEKYTKIPMLFERRHDSKMRFSFVRSGAGEPDRTVSGTILLNRDASRMPAWDYDGYARNSAILTPDDTTGLHRRLLTDLYFTLQVASGAIYRVGVDEYSDPDSPLYGGGEGDIRFSFRYRGAEGGDRLFEATNEAYREGSPRPLRYLFRVDGGTRRIRSSESIHVLPRSRHNQHTAATYALYRLRWLKPESASLDAVDPRTGETFRLELREITYNSLGRRERKLVYDRPTRRGDQRRTAREEMREFQQKRTWWGRRPE